MSNYVRQQFERLDQSARFALKVRGDLGETHWIGVPPASVRRIADLLAEDGIDTTTVPANQPAPVALDLDTLADVLTGLVGSDVCADVLGEYLRRVTPTAS